MRLSLLRRLLLLRRREAIRKSKAHTHTSRVCSKKVSSSFSCCRDTVVHTKHVTEQRQKLMTYRNMLSENIDINCCSQIGWRRVGGRYPATETDGGGGCPPAPSAFSWTQVHGSTHTHTVTILTPYWLSFVNPNKHFRNGRHKNHRSSQCQCSWQNGPH